MNKKFFAISLISCLLIITACQSLQPPSNESKTLSLPKEEDRVQLRVSLFPWVPEPDSFIKWIEADFESKHPKIDLVVRPLENSYDWVKDKYVADLAYETDKTIAALTDKDNPDFQHLVEIDTVILGALAERGALAPFSANKGSFFQSAAESVRWKGTTLGVPHWMCGYFVISNNKAVRDAKNISELLLTLKSAATDRVDLAGDLDGSWDSVSLYLDAYSDTYPKNDLKEALMTSELDPAIAKDFRAIGSACTKNRTNYCGKDATDFFAAGNADALIGYSERLHSILSHTDKKVGSLYIASATLGDGDHPALFTDALVMSPHCSSEQCQNAAKQFATYYVSEEVFEVTLLALDSKSSVPRYLLPSTTSSLDFGRVAKDKIYSQLKDEIQGAQPIPNQGIPRARDEGIIRQNMKKALGL